MASMYADENHARLYVRFRPVYPDEMYDRIYSYLDDDNSEKSRKLAVDAGCGTGQTTRALASRFDRAVGFDASEAQVKEALQANADLSNLSFHCASANDLSGFLTDGSVDLMTAATSLHWLDAKKFYVECARVLRPGGVLAAFCYGYPTLYEPLAAEAFLQFSKAIENCNMPETQHVWDRYKRLFTELQTVFKHSERDDSFKIQLKLSIEEFCGFVCTFSAYQKLRRDKPNDRDPAVELSEKLQIIYGVTPQSKDVVTGCLEIFMILAKNF